MTTVRSTQLAIAELIETGYTYVYTVPPGVVALLKSVRVFNLSGDDAQVRIVIFEDETPLCYLDWVSALANEGGETYDVWTVLTAGQRLGIYTSASGVWILASGAELTAP